MKRISIFVINKTQKRAREAIRTWYSNAFDFIKNNQSVLELAAQKADFKHSSKFFYIWRSEYFNSLRKYDNKMESITIIKEITERKEEWKMRVAVSVWKEKTEWAKITTVKLRSLIRRKQNILLSKSLGCWVSTLRKTKEKEKYILLKTHLTEAKIRQKVFYAWKIVNLDSKSKRDLDKFYEWKNSCEMNRKIKCIERGNYLVNLSCSENEKYLILKTFNALKIHMFNEKYLKCIDLLENENSRKEECERKLAQLNTLNETKIKYQVFRKAFSRYTDVEYTAFSQWKHYAKYKRVMLERIESQLSFLHRNRLNDTFQKWRNLNNKSKILELQKVNEEILTDNTLIAQDIKKLDSQKRVLQDLSQHIKEMKIER